ncbi:MAG: DUF4388 domain-containing protein [Candidatus Latescibacteria bacterium]|nr:DUF4388 domain-containing protein [Candidatus Latescibacterota bacterium]NIO27320.1 DUF4388 domain-containing protein [Candidatus Latescibacterota bacterium]NIO54844.1 DUF4388 domain-containing protein [Candidatus Latescibacterota bacterium]NIT00927.1 DUF4388 domain-containing protein [Candidatus Latescibacterota bacterium]NIT37850.1 DUF4388 domain-containing protein [Candidatus Latescibacterota bacterium]
MALEGNLTAFGLSEIFQLIAVQQKSGMLSVNSEDRSMVIFFKGGSLVSTRDRRRRSSDPLKDYFTRYGILSQADLMRIMDISAKSKLDMTEVIVSENFLTEEEMRRHYRNQIQEAVHEILTWEQCSYKFIPSQEILDGLKTWGEFGIEGMLMESMRRIDEFPEMLKVFPDPSMVILRTDKEAPEDLAPNEKTILDLLSEERTLNYLISQGKMSSFETYEALKHLKEKELIDTKGDRLVATAKPAAESRTIRQLRRMPRRFIATGFVFLLFSSSLFFGAKTSLRYLKPQADHLQDALHDETLARHRMEEKLRCIIEAYRSEFGSYPRTLAMLSESEFVTEGFIKRLERFSFRYHLTPGVDAYTLL